MSAISRKYGSSGDNAVNFYEFFLTPTISLKLAQRYTNICLMSSNSRGMIFSATDTAKNAPVAIKFLNRTFDSAELAKHTYREISLLLKANHKNIVKMVNLISPEICTGEKVDSFNVYIVLEKVSHTLTHVINMARIGKSRLTHKHISFLLYQILCAVKYLHESNIMHRDLKPDNIGVNDQGCEVKLLDFGLSCVQAHDLKHSPYVVTRFYRAPEIVLGLEYSKKVDLWSVGCILAEMISKKIMFPGEHYFLQWQTIVHVLGKPGRNFLQKMDERTREYALSPGPQGGQSWEEMFPAEKYSLPEDEAPIDLKNAISFMQKTLVIDSDERYDITQAMDHDYPKYWLDVEETNVPSLDLSDYNEEVVVSKQDQSVDHYRDLIRRQLEEYGELHDVFLG